MILVQVLVIGCAFVMEFVDDREGPDNGKRD